MSAERRQCPKEFQDRLTQRVGLNRYGEPNFIIAWGQTYTYKAGGVWPHDGFKGYRDLLLSNSSMKKNGEPCWMILEWHPPEDYGTPGLYYYLNRDEDTGLQILGEYPYRGRYEVAFKLTSTEFVGGRLQVKHYQLDGYILDALIPAILEGQRMTIKQRLKRLREAEEKREKDLDNKVSDILHASKRRILPSQLDDRVRLIQQQMSVFLKNCGRVQPGMKLGSITA